MNKVLIALLLAFSSLTLTSAQEKPAYLVYDSSGVRVSYDKIIGAAVSADVIFLGELHNNPIAHWLELEITKDISSLNDTAIVLGAEMFERDDQLQIDEYFSDKYAASKFEAEVKLWPNYSTDYKPVLEFAREAGVRFVATNVPRRYASMVSKKGFECLDSLTADATTYIAPLPIEYDPEVKCYKDMLESMDMGPHVSKNLPKAQALKDATMAYSIAENHEQGAVFIHLNGSYHSSNYQGIIWYLKKYRPGLKIVTVEVVEQDDIVSLDEENRGVADFIVAVPSSMTKTY